MLQARDFANVNTGDQILIKTNNGSEVQGEFRTIANGFVQITYMRSPDNTRGKAPWGTNPQSNKDGTPKMDVEHDAVPVRDIQSFRTLN